MPFMIRKSPVNSCKLLKHKKAEKRQAIIGRAAIAEAVHIYTFCKNNIMKIFFLGIGFLAAFMSSGCDAHSDGSKNASEGSQPGEWRPFAKTDRDKERDFVQPIIVLAFDGKFEELDQLVEELHQKKIRHSDGSWAIDNFFNAFTEYDSYNQVDPEKWQPILEKRLLDWVEKHPEPVAAAIALSGFYGDYAWAVINTHDGGPLSEEQRITFGRRLNNALNALSEADPSVKAWPSAWTLYLSLGRPAGFQKNKVLELFTEMQTTDPKFWHIYSEMVSQYLVPWRQGSSHREWHDWLLNALDHPMLTLEDRDLIYARVVLNLMHYDYSKPRFPDPYVEAGVDWVRLQRGARALINTFPSSTRLPTYYLSAAVLKNDEPAIREALLVLKPHYDPGLWSGKGDKEFFELLERLRQKYPSLSDVIE